MTITIESASQTAFTFKSDVPTLARTTHKSGILHCLKRTKKNNNTNNEDCVAREEHAFVWLDDVTASTRGGGGVAAVVAEMGKYGFDGGGMMFLPYSRKDNWIRRYPHACPYIECNSIGQISGVPYFQECIAAGSDSDDTVSESDTDSVGQQPYNKKQKQKQNPSNKNKNAPPAPKLFPSANLTDPERSQLHIQIYDYLSWLHSHLIELETTENGRSKLRRKGISTPGIQNILTKFEGSFKNVSAHKKEKEKEKENNESGNDADNNNTQNNNQGDATTDSSNNENEKENNTSSLLPNDNKTPILEDSLKFNLSQIVEEMHRKKLEEEARKNPPPATSSSTADTSRSNVAKSTLRDFNFLFSRLVAFRERKGNTLIPIAYKDDDGVALGRWASEIRARKRVLMSMKDGTTGLGQEYETPQFKMVNIPVIDGGKVGLTLSIVAPSSSETTNDAPGISRRPGATITEIDPQCPFLNQIEVGDRLVLIDGVEVRTPEDFDRNKGEKVRVFGFERVVPPSTCTHLSKERVERLNSIGFSWDGCKRDVRSWDERFALLKQYMAEHDGQLPRRNEQWNKVGVWVHNQRRQWVLKDKKFMKERAPKLDAIGFTWVHERFRGMVPWEDNFQRLVEFSRVNRHFNVPRPEKKTGDNEKENSENEDALRFYKWVMDLNCDYKRYKRGKGSSLNEDRANKLLELGFHLDDSQASSKKRGWRNVPDYPFEKRLEQVQNYQEQHGHLNIDFRYSHRENFGGWATQMSLRYKDWQEGKVEESPLMQHQFNQLLELGFAFNVFPEDHTRRTWDENFEIFLKFQQKYGHSNVPLVCATDKRLGVWVFLQRNQYQLLVEGKKSKLTQEKYNKLESAGFIWETFTKQKRSRELEE